MKSDFIWMDGELVPFEEATVHFITPTLHYGPGVFEGIRCYETSDGPAVFRLEDHLVRFLESIHILGIQDFPYTVGQLRDAVHETIRANGFRECYIRPLMYLKGPLGLNMDASSPAVGIATWEWGPYLGAEARDQGVSMMVASFSRLHPNVNMTKSKVAGNYVNSMLVKTLALRAGFDEAVILDTQGFVSECTGENLLMVRKGTIYTPPLATVLEGLTLNTVLKLAEDLGIPVREQVISRDQLYIADELMICGTAAEVVGVRELDYRQIGSGGVGPVTKKMQEAFERIVHGQEPRYENWLDRVALEPEVG
ncbi:MAG: branched-chain amino acid transaminase [Anaerolineales bacterium]|nr:branched-chain amino acid transaminase [Anaerolineales bacterium]